MSEDHDVKPLLVEIRDIVLRHEEVNRKEAEFRKRVLFVLLFALVVAVLAMGYALMIVHTTIKDIRQRQEQLQPQKVAVVRTATHFDLNKTELKRIAKPSVGLILIRR